MTPTAQGILERLRTAHERGQRLVLVFDYDGTLTPVAAHPRLGVLDPTSRATLARLATIPRITVGVISGRGLDNLMGMVDLPGLNYGGSTGLELELAGKRFVPAEALASRALLDTLETIAEAPLAAYPGTWLERKPFGFTVHYRQLAPERVEALRAEIIALLAVHATALRILDGPMCIEVIPAIAKDKGTALRAIVAQNDPESTLALYAGDSPNDAPALAAAGDLGGIALGIGPEPPAEATEYLPGPAELIALLAALVATLTETAVS